MSRLPTDDLELEMEEVEGLVTTGRVGSGVGSSSRRVSSSKTASSLLSRMCDGKYRVRWACLLTTLAVLLVVLLLSDTETILRSSNEDSSSSNKSNVEDKPAAAATTTTTTTSPPTLAPTQPQVLVTPAPIMTSAPPTPAPTTLPPTPAPTSLPPTPAPTVTTVSPTPGPTVAAVTPAPTVTTTSADAMTGNETTHQPDDNDNNATSATTTPQTTQDTGATSSTTPPPPPPPSDMPFAMAQRWARGDSWRPKDFVVRGNENNDSTTSTTSSSSSPVVNEELAKTWGRWQFSDPSPPDNQERPSLADLVQKYPQGDVPRDQFPQNAWQTDPAYLKAFLSEADALVDRAMNAILAEYGHGPRDEPDKSLEQRSDMFSLEFKDFQRRLEVSSPSHSNNNNDWRSLRGPPPLPKGGWTTRRSFDGMVRRLLHAIMTQDTFSVILGGHSAAAGHGNWFRQSYMMQFHKVMEPVFSYLGVTLVSRNLAQGGLGTLQSGLGAGSIYGEEMDVLLWDSGMTESRDLRAIDMFGRQGMIGGNRVPFLWGGDWGLLQQYHEAVDADVGVFGMGDAGVAQCKNETHAETIPYAARYMKCDDEVNDLCHSHKFHSNCWVERPDVTPERAQAEHPPSQVGWHPGNRSHQLTGRVLAFTVLKALKEAISKWKNADGYALPDDAWHVADYYENIRTKVKNLPDDFGFCKQFEGIPLRMCKTPIKARTQFTPRSNPLETSILNIVRPGPDGYWPDIAQDVFYDGPDVHDPFLDIPEGEVNVVAILNNGRKFPEPQQEQRRLQSPTPPRPLQRRTDSGIVPGTGWAVNGEPPGYCDGTWNAVCGRLSNSDCLMLGHHDARGGIKFNSVSGWIVMDVPKVQEGIIVIKLETWHNVVADRPDGWKPADERARQLRERATTTTTTSTENDAKLLQETVDHRNAKAKPPDYCDNFKFEYAIDGKITTYAGEEEFVKHDFNLQRVVELFVLLDDPDHVKEPEGKDVEVAIRMTGCGDEGSRAHSLTHVYWA